MKKSNLYTKTGDKGETSLVSGTRVSKSDQRIDLYGEVDHLNSYVGFAKSKVNNSSLEKELTEVQNRLFDIGSLLSCEKKLWEKYKLPTIEAKSVENLEKYIDQMDSSLPSLKNFILPGGSEGSSLLHICRTLCRKTERKLVGFDNGEDYRLILEFLNRLSDYFFVAARFINNEVGIKEDVWSPNS